MIGFIQICLGNITPTLIALYKIQFWIIGDIFIGVQVHRCFYSCGNIDVRIGNVILPTPNVHGYACPKETVFYRNTDETNNGWYISMEHSWISARTHEILTSHTENYMQDISYQLHNHQLQSGWHTHILLCVLQSAYVPNQETGWQLSFSWLQILISNLSQNLPNKVVDIDQHMIINPNAHVINHAGSFAFLFMHHFLQKGLRMVFP